MSGENVKNIFKPYPNRSLEDLRLVLEESRAHIESKWVSGNWFTSEVWVDDEMMVTLEDDSVLDKVFYDEESGTEMTGDVKVTGMCAAGSVLYALDYTDQQWSDHYRVRPVIEELFMHLPDVELLLSDMRETYRWGFTSRSARAKSIYQYKLESVINFNDNSKKEDVLNLFDQAIKGVIGRMEKI